MVSYSFEFLLIFYFVVFVWVWTQLNLINLFLQCFCSRLKDRELVPHVISTPPNNHHRSVHLLCDIAGASDNGEPQGLWPQRRPHTLQLQCGGPLTLHVLWSKSFTSTGALLRFCLYYTGISFVLSSFVKNPAVTHGFCILVKCTHSWNLNAWQFKVKLVK